MKSGHGTDKHYKKSLKDNHNTFNLKNNQTSSRNIFYRHTQTVNVYFVCKVGSYSKRNIE